MEFVKTESQDALADTLWGHALMIEMNREGTTITDLVFVDESGAVLARVRPAFHQGLMVEIPKPLKVTTKWRLHGRIYPAYRGSIEIAEVFDEYVHATNRQDVLQATFTNNSLKVIGVKFDEQGNELTT